MTLIKIVLAILVVTIVYFLLIQRSMLFPVPTRAFPETLPADAKHIPLARGYAILLPPLRVTRDASPLLIFAHGNAEVAHWIIDEMSTMRAAGFSVLLLEYPGYAGAPGSPSLKSMRQSALEAYDQVVSLPSVDADRVIAYGRSIGGGVASLIAAERPVAALGLESTFSTLTRLAAEHRMPWFLLLDRFDNESIVSSLRVPVFLYHGTSDQIIPVHHSERLSQVASDSEFFQASCGHNDCPPAWTPLLEFLRNRSIR